MATDQGPLRGLTVLDLSTNVASAYASLLFADFGADVVQVEPPGGSPIRQIAGWPFWMRGKRSVVLDLDVEDDREVARRLAAGSDVVIEAFGAPFADERGLGYDALSAANPGLVYAAITAFGSEGPLAGLKPYESVVAAKTGNLYGNVAPQRPGEPVMLIPYSLTFAAALLAMQGTLLALHEREQSGHGQRVDATLLGGLMAQDPWNYIIMHLAAKFADAFQGGLAPNLLSPVPTSWLLFSLTNGYTKEGRWLQFSNAAPRQYAAFLRVLGLDGPEWEGAADHEDEEVRRRLWNAILEGARSRTVEEWQEVFDREHDVFAELYRRDLELFEHPQMLHDKHVVEVESDRLGSITELAPLVKMWSTPGSPDGVVPTVDEHGDELRASAPEPRPAPSSPPPAAHPPLDGLVIVDIGTYYAGSFGSTMLADQGATVIKIEPLEGDPIRFLMPFPEAAGVRVTQGKKSVAVDAFTDEGRAIVVELIKQADMVLHCYRGGVAERMGLSADAMLALNPNLVYHHGVGYGIDGPYAQRAAYAPTIAAGSGFARRCGGLAREGVELSLDEIKTEGHLLSGPTGGVLPDGQAALGVGVGLALGLYARDRGAGGQQTLTSMLSTMGHAQGDSLIAYDGAPPPRHPGPDFFGFSALERLYRTTDGWVVVSAVEEREWRALAETLGLVGDDRFSDAASRAANDDALVDALAERLGSKTAAEWEQVLSEAGVGCAEVAPPGGGIGASLFGEGGVGDRHGMLTKVTHPVFDEHVRATELVKLSRGTATLGAGCAIGQHTDEVLRERLGFDDARLAELRAAGVIGG